MGNNNSTNIIPEAFDAHCHIFNVSFLLKEVKEIFFHWVTGNYEIDKEDYKKSSLKSLKHEGFKQKIKDLLNQIYELGSACVDTEEDNYLFIRNEAKKAWGVEVGIIPLMMDIYYYFAPPVKENTLSVSIPKTFMISKFDQSGFEKEFAGMLDETFDQIAKKRSIKDGDKNNYSSKLKGHFEEAKRNNKYQYSARNVLYDQLFMTNGFKNQLDNLINLVNKHQYPVYPFLAVDPRRPGIMDSIKGESLVSKTGPFYGVKLYPRLGYHPRSKPVKEILDICKERDLPVTVHCGKSGFPPGTDWKFFDYGNPANFSDSLADNKLRINFAHLGSSDDSFEWAKTIIDFMNKYDEVYSDLSCYTSMNEIKNIKNKFWNDESRIKDRLMYGSDYDVMYFTNAITLANYYKSFSYSFSQDELVKMRSVVPKNFLKLGN